MVLTTNYPVLVLLTRAYTIKIEGSYGKLRQQNLVSLIVTYCNARPEPDGLPACTSRAAPGHNQL